MLSKLSTLFHTLIHLKPIQAIYQVKNRLTKVGHLSSFQIPVTENQKFNFFNAPSINIFLKEEPAQVLFNFLNLSRSYPDTTVDWNDQSHGKLWNYNLQYLDFLKQDGIALAIKIDLLKDFYTWLWIGKLPLEPYPASLRIMNLIRFLNTQEIEQESRNELLKYLLAELNYLSQNLEFHLLANHLLENAFAFWMGGLFFNHSEWIARASKLLKSQLDEQILKDGAHYELAPMYHQIILFRVMEAYQLTPAAFDLKILLKDKAELMLGWLNQMTFPDGTLPHFNDTTEGIAYSSKFLLETAHSIGLIPKNVKLNESGYRVFESDHLKLIVDVEGIKPSYQPGHAHADTFSFVLFYGKIPVVVDPGISTYTISPRRDWERSTLAHNTVTVDGENSSQVWDGFRVGKRATVKILEDKDQALSAIHDGFGDQKHQRIFMASDIGFELVDKIIGLKSSSLAEARFHFHPDINPKIISNTRISLLEDLFIEVQGASHLEILDYSFCMGYNNLISAKLLLATFERDTLVTSISLEL